MTTEPAATAGGATRGDDVVRLEVADAVATVTLDAPGNGNALSRRLVRELGQRLEDAAADPSVRAVLLTATGRTFCSGADLTEAGTAGMDEGAREVLALLRRMLTLDLPVVGRVHGPVRAGGIGLVGACDVAVGAEDATFAFPEARLGLTPAVVSLTTLPRMGPRSAARLFLTGETVDGREAARLGLLTAAVPADTLADEVERVLTRLRASSAQGLAATKHLLTRDLVRDLDRDGPEMAALTARLFSSDEARAHMRAALDRASGPA